MVGWRPSKSEIRLFAHWLQRRCTPRGGMQAEGLATGSLARTGRVPDPLIFKGRVYRAIALPHQRLDHRVRTAHVRTVPAHRA